MLYSNKRLQNTKRYKEYQSLEDKYYKLSLAKEKNQQEYLKYNIIKDSSTNKIININYNFDKYYKKYTKSIEQKVYTIENIAKEKNLLPVFITLTLPSIFHPFKSINYKSKRLYTALNKEFEFKNIEDSITTGYQYLNHIYRIFYKRVKNNVNNLLYVKVVEMHKTFIPHFHILFYVKKEEIRIIRKNFDKIHNEFSLNQTDLELIANELQNENNVKTGVNRASKYIMKYITKTLSSGKDYFTARVIDGWKRQHKIRMITMSNLDLSLADFRAIYYNLDNDSKEKILQDSKEEGKSIFHYIMKNIYKLKVIKKDNLIQIQEFGDIKQSKFILASKVIQIKKVTGAYHKKIDSFKFFIDHTLIYDKPKYKKIRRKNYEYKININWTSLRNS